MIKSAVTEFFIHFFKENEINTEEISLEIGIFEGKLQPDYKEPLTAEEFLQLCAYLRIPPEEIAAIIKQSKNS